MFYLFLPNFSQILDGYFSWQVQYLVKLDDNIYYSVYYIYCFICNKYHSWEIFFVAGAMTLVAPHIINNVLYMQRTNHDIHFSWQA